MATITFTLVLEVAFRPSSSSWPPSEEAVAALASLDLSGRGVAVIDNLEPFCDLRALNLSRNVIREVDNIYFLNKLEELDLSYNRISDIDCLRKSKHYELLSCMSYMHTNPMLKPPSFSYRQLSPRAASAVSRRQPLLRGRG